jgi:hypothetical protein
MRKQNTVIDVERVQDFLYTLCPLNLSTHARVLLFNGLKPVLPNWIEPVRASFAR